MQTVYKSVWVFITQFLFNLLETANLLLWGYWFKLFIFFSPGWYTIYIDSTLFLNLPSADFLSSLGKKDLGYESRYHTS